MTIRIRPILREDLPAVLAWRNHPNVRRYMYTQQEIAWEDHLVWFEKTNSDDSRHVMIFERDDEPSGLVNISCVSPRDSRAEWGFYLSPDAPKGSGLLMGELACQFVFESLELHKLCGEVLGYNQRSIRFHHRLSFEQEGTLRDHHFDGEHYHDVVVFGLLAHDWKKHRSE